MRDDPLSILHVDDDPNLGGLVKTYLERGSNDVDCTVTTETSPTDALDRIRSGGPEFDCVVSDYNMPEMNGIDFLEAVRETHPELPLLLFSGEETNDVAAEIIRAGVTDYLRKGTGTDQYTMLIRRVEHAVEGGGQFDPEAETELDGVGVVGSDERFEDVDDTYARSTATIRRSSRANTGRSYTPRRRSSTSARTSCRSSGAAGSGAVGVGGCDRTAAPSPSRRW